MTHFVATIILLLATTAPTSQPADARDRWVTLSFSLRDVEGALVASNQAQTLSAADWKAINPTVIAARANLESADKELVTTGEKPSARIDYFLDIAESQVAQLKRYRILTQKRGVP